MIEYIGEGGYINDGDNLYTFQVTDNPREFDSFRADATDLDWDSQRYHLGKWTIFPYGNNNQLPKLIRDVVQKNYIAPGLMKKKTQWLWGKGPKLYVEQFTDEGKLYRKWLEESEIQAWLDSWDYESYLVKCCVDFSYVEGVWTKFIQSRAGRVSSPRISRLEFVQTDHARLAVESNALNAKPTHGVVTDWNFQNISSILDPRVYPLYDFTNPFKYKHSIYYSNMYSFCSDYYNIPDVYGSLEWLRRSTAVPIILAAMSKNSMNVKYHVISPQKFWDDKEKELKEIATKKGEKYTSKMLKKYKDSFLREVAKVLSSAENTGKFWHSTKQLEVEGTNLLEHGWEIKELPNNITNFVEGQIKISERADHAVSAGVGLGSVLGNVSESGNRNSGSDRIYAMKDYLDTGIDIPEMLVLKPINFAIKANWPGTKVKLGFYHNEPKKEQEQTPEERTLNT